MMRTVTQAQSALSTFQTLATALDAALIRTGEVDELDVVNEVEIWDAFECIRSDDAANDAYAFLSDAQVGPRVMAAMDDVSFSPSNARHLCLAICLYGAIHLRG